MAEFTIYIGNKNYSSWSLRGWLMLKAAGIAFDEVVIPLYEPQSRTEMLRHSPVGQGAGAACTAGVVRSGNRWRSANIWPSSCPQAQALARGPRGARAVARAVSNEMHAGFLPLRRHLPMNMRSSLPVASITPEVQGDIDRITALWRDCRQRFGARRRLSSSAAFTIADAMFAPVVSRFRTYQAAARGRGARPMPTRSPPGRPIRNGSRPRATSR